VTCKIGRKASAKTIPEPSNGYFDAKVLSRTHAELSFDRNTVFIQDLKSSNGTFVNGERLSEEGVLSVAKPLQTGDIINFGVDIKDEDGNLLYNKVAAKVTIRYDVEGSAVPRPSQSAGTRRSDTDELLAMIQVLPTNVG
jgi:pSer/pThr/pTyr-binding forkhead associated (FHA) protein